MSTKSTRTAEAAYMENHTAALELAQRITAAIENHDVSPAPEQIHWGHVGDIAEIRSTLQAISDRMFDEGEYAPEAD